MDKLFDILFLDEAFEFLSSLEKKVRFLIDAYNHDLERLGFK